MEYRGDREPNALGYEFEREDEARASATELDRRFTGLELSGLRVYRIRWNDNYLVEATFSDNISENRLRDARALLGESGNPVHPDDLQDYKQATEAISSGSLPDWLRRLFGGGH